MLGAPDAGVIGDVSFLGAEFGLAVNPPVTAVAFAFVFPLVRLFSGKGTPFAEDFETDKA